MHDQKKCINFVGKTLNVDGRSKDHTQRLKYKDREKEKEKERKRKREREERKRKRERESARK